MGGAFGFGPGRRGEGFQVRGLCFGQAFENVLEIFGRVDPVPPATAQHRVDHRAALPGFGMADEQKVLLPDGRGPDGVLYAEMPVMPRTGCIGVTNFFVVVLFTELAS